jgi:hypothetical protein
MVHTVLLEAGLWKQFRRAYSVSGGLWFLVALAHGMLRGCTDKTAILAVLAAHGVTTPLDGQ